ncbi:hypothetical protein SUGI_0359370 [Cryptomeria japonica]|nr:hypothetical protein SUGI_0359370 [Cryptomeria japonica]
MWWKSLLNVLTASQFFQHATFLFKKTDPMEEDQWHNMNSPETGSFVSLTLTDTLELQISDGFQFGYKEGNTENPEKN